MTTLFQSPINLGFRGVSETTLPSRLRYRNRILKYAYDGTGQEWKVTTPQPRLRVNDTVSNLVSFHLSQPGEHTLDRRSFPIEVQFMFADSKGYITGLAFVARVRSSRASPFFKHLVNGETLRIPPLISYFSYTGSLTGTSVNPSTTNVNWFVSDIPLRITSTLLSTLASQSRAAKSIQERAGRTILFYSPSICEDNEVINEVEERNSS
jgi:carbonic anhydrase